MAISKTREGIHPKLDELRALVAREIIRYEINRGRNAAHIRTNADYTELFAQYSLRIFLNWVAANQRFPICTEGIETGVDAGLERLGAWKFFRDRYPFYRYFDNAFETELQRKGSARLEETLRAARWTDNSAAASARCDEMETVGILYMRTLVSPIVVDDDGRVTLPKRTDNRTRGEFYTPRWLVDYCVSHVDIDPDKTVLDPACGTGNFLLGALRNLIAKGYTADRIVEFAKNRLYGTDIDPSAVELAIANLVLFIDSIDCNADFVELVDSLRKNVRVADSLFCMTENQFHVVITNPPYISFGARNQSSISKSQSAYFRAQYPESAEYKIRVHSMFQQLCVRCARDGGDVILLVPDAYLTGAFYQKLRKYLSRECQIAAITELPESCFKDATAGRWAVAHYRKQKNKSDCDVHCRRFSAAGKLEESFALPAPYLVTADKHRFQLLFNQCDADIFSKLAHCQHLDTLFRGHTGIRAREGQATIISTKSRGSDWQRGLISGSSVTAHHVEWDGKWLNIDKEKLFGGGHNASLIQRPKVLVRQTGDRLIAAVDRNGLYHLNNVHSFIACDEKDDALIDYLSVLMNSQLWLYIYQTKSRESGRALAQIDIEMAESMPIPPTSTMGVLLKQVAAAKRPYAISTLRAFDRLVYDAYSLTESESNQVERFCMVRRMEYTSHQLPSSGQAATLIESLWSCSTPSS